MRLARFAHELLVSEVCQVNKFIWGLQTKLRMHVIAHDHLGCEEVVRVARAVESSFTRSD